MAKYGGDTRMPWPELPPAPENWPDYVRTGYQMTWYFARVGRRDVMVPDIARIGWSRCFGTRHADESDRWYRPYESGVFHLTKKRYYCSLECAREEAI